MWISLWKTLLIELELLSTTGHARRTEYISMAAFNRAAMATINLRNFAVIKPSMKKEPLFWVLVALDIIYILSVSLMERQLERYSGYEIGPLGFYFATFPFLILQVIAIFPILFSRKNIWLLIFLLFFVISFIYSGADSNETFSQIVFVAGISVIVSWVFLAKKNLRSN